MQYFATVSGVASRVCGGMRGCTPVCSSICVACVADAVCVLLLLRITVRFQYLLMTGVLMRSCSCWKLSSSMDWEIGMFYFCFFVT